jgi:hypothetical protein
VWSIVHKEYRQRARGLATLGLIITYTIILGIVAFLVYFGSYTALQARQSTSGDVGLAMAIAVFIAQMIMALLLSLSLNASTIAHEKDQETFELLNLTLFKSWEIVFGKFTSSTGFLFILVFTALPIYALALAFGGVTVDALWQLAAVVVGMTIFISSLGIVLSLVSEDVRTALSRSFFLLILLGVGTMIPGFALVGSFNQTAPGLFTYWFGALALLINPLWSAIDVFNPYNIQWPAPQPVVVPLLIKDNLLWLWSALAQLLIALLVLLITTAIYPRYRASKTGDIV